MKLAAKLEDLRKDYILKSETVRALRGVTFSIPQGDYVAIMGPSGSGKSTLLNLLGCLDRPTGGSLFLGDSDVSTMNDNQLSYIRASSIGFVFQSYNLIPVLTAIENVELPLLVNGVSGSDARRQAQAMLERVGLGARLEHHPNELSGGEQQRVTIARALVGEPAIVWADEPTGNLDVDTAGDILELLSEVHRQGQTIVMVTHDPEIGSMGDRLVSMQNGMIVSGGFPSVVGAEA